MNLKKIKPLVAMVFLIIISLFISNYNGCNPPNTPPPDTLDNPPLPPKLLAPPNDTTIYYETPLPPTITLIWSTVEDAERYQIQVSTDSTFTGAVYMAATDSVYEHQIFSSGRFFWHVRAANNGWKYATEWSETWIFNAYYTPP